MWKIIFTQLILRLTPANPVLAVIVSRFRVMPWDIDSNMHMNNVRYLKYLEKGRIDHCINTPFFIQCYNRRWHAVIVNISLNYIRSLKPLQKFEVVTRIKTWDDKYFYFEQTFTSKGQVYANALLRLAILHGKQKISPTDALSLMMPDVETSPLPASAVYLNKFIHAQRVETETINNTENPTTITDPE